MSVFFSIDNEANPIIRAAFVAHVSALSLAGGFLQCLGVYKGQSEFSFAMDSGDFDQYVKGSEWIKGQESVLHVASGNKQEAILEFLQSGEFVGIGCMKNVSREEAIAAGDYTFRFPDQFFPDGAYFVAFDGNPDSYVDVEDAMCD